MNFFFVIAAGIKENILDSKFGCFFFQSVCGDNFQTYLIPCIQSVTVNIDWDILLPYGPLSRQKLSAPATDFTEGLGQPWTAHLNYC